MIVVDSSVWIDHFRGAPTPQSDALDQLLDSEPLAVGDLMLAEMLQGFERQRDFDRALGPMDGVMAIDVAGRDIATRCIEDGHALLYSDRDFDPFVRHLAWSPPWPSRADLAYLAAPKSAGRGKCPS